MPDSEPLGPLGAGDPTAPQWMPPEIDRTVATPARIYSYLLGGKEHFAVDRAAVEQAAEALPVRDFARVNRAFLTRAVRHLAEAALDQFLDIGVGLPAPGSTAETALSVRHDARIVGVDNDPIVLAHARAHGGEGATVVAGDVRRPGEILQNPEVRARLDFDRPVAVLIVAVMHFVPDEDDPYGAVRALMDAVAPGSVLVLSQVTSDLDPDGIHATAKAYARSSVRTAVRSREQIAAFFDGLEPIDPGPVMLSRWRPDEQVRDGDDRIGMYGGVAVKP
ncbi:2-polyprenyl-3-methyl-5-hydroxy-6-metoxy-1,4-benzoquinol methylase [Streptacidiphilus jiangxiensis]|uniref:2-polyprenyl-3-methyl-5-hydroxy-6-metoxy-1,4-benzoquinol methylase n=1 Tax=Streptacidiphilus jiangxiensis TaxID=235985 RepID=A0A1H7HR01_STRJI|nr:SAM-dependent methyltransferase [Streptacidiphilus jiangxiensis]SEK52813.1 2-polyprenyl-3-methyl-5-hydroxy-6-metoxy-1,4-benzoquinol methylase [Streptacidiphilus jiangxiensis]